MPRHAALPAALAAVGPALAAARFPLATPSAPTAEAERRALAQQLDDYLLPRLARLDAPLLVVVGGSTGAGKSTLVNSLVGEPVSPSGVLRPTTRRPVVVVHPDDAAWFDGRGPDAPPEEEDPAGPPRDEDVTASLAGAPRPGAAQVLPGLARALDDPTGSEPPPPGTAPAQEGEALGLVVTERLPPGVAVLDAPDVDSVVEANRDLARRLLAAADLWLFVTTAARYADAVPWTLLREARDRGAALAVVCDRVPPGAGDEVAGHLRSLLSAEGLAGAEVLVIPETTVDADGLLPDELVASLRGRLEVLARDADARAAVVRRTLLGALAVVAPRLEGLADAAREQVSAAEELERSAAQAYATAAAEVREALADGSVLRGEVLARWTELVGTPDISRTLQGRVAWLRDKVAVLAGSGSPLAEPAQVGDALVGGVASVVAAAGGRAARDAGRAWSARPDGRELLAQAREGGREGLELASDTLPAEAQAAVDAWRVDVMRLVTSQGAQRRGGAKALSWGVNGTGLAVMLAVFTSTGGLTGAEVLVAGGTSAVATQLMSAVLGDQVLRGLVRQAREMLLTRAGELLDAEHARFADAVQAAGVAAQAPALLEEAAAGLSRAHAREPEAVGGRALPPEPEPGALGAGDDGPRALEAAPRAELLAAPGDLPAALPLDGPAVVPRHGGPS